MEDNTCSIELVRYLGICLGKSDSQKHGFVFSGMFEARYKDNLEWSTIVSFSLYDMWALSSSEITTPQELDLLLEFFTDTVQPHQARYYRDPREPWGLHFLGL